MSHPFDSVLIDNVDPYKADFRDYVASRTRLVLANSSEIQSMTLPSGCIEVSLEGQTFTYDSGDTVSAHNGTTVLVDAGGRRYTIVATAGSGDDWGDAVDADIIPDADGTRDLGSSANRFAELHVDTIDLNGTTATSIIGKTAPTGDVVGTSDTQTLTGKTIDGDDNTLQDIPYSAIKSDSRSGSDVTLITGTAGTDGDLALWNADGDLVDGPTPPTGDIVGTSDSQTLSNKTLASPTISGTVADNVNLANNKRLSWTNTSAATGDGGVYLDDNDYLVFEAGASSRVQVKSNNAGALLADITTSKVDFQDLDIATTGDIEVGHASDSTLSRTGAGILAVEGDDILLETATQTVTNKTIDGDSNTISNLDIGNEVDWAASADVTDASAFESGDKLLVFEAGVGLRKVDYDDLPGSSGGDAWSDAVDADIVPDADGTRDLGSSANRFAELHVDTIDLNGTTATSIVGKTAPTGDVVGTSDSQTLTGKTIDGDDNTLQDIPYSAIKSDSRSGSDTTLVTGTAGTDGDLAQWNADGDLVDGPTPPSGDIVGTTDSQTLSGKTLASPTISGTVADNVNLANNKRLSWTNTSAATGDGGVYLDDNDYLVFEAGASSRIQLKTNNAGAVMADITSTTVDFQGLNIATTGSIEVGHASDSTLSRTGAGILAVEGDDILLETATQTVTGKTIDGDSNTISNLDIGNEVDWAAATDVTDASAFESGDKLLIFEAGVGLSKIDYDDLPGSSGGDAWSDAVDADIIPDGDGTRDLGSSANRFAELHVDTIDLNGTAVTSIVGKTAPSGDVVGTSDTQTLTGKTINTASNTITIATSDIGSGTLADARVAESNVTQHQAALLTNAPLTGSPVEEGYAISGTTPAIDPANGSMQRWTLSGNSTPTSSFGNGESCTIEIDDGTAYTINWSSLVNTWLTDGGSAPTLKTSGITAVGIWRSNGTNYGVRIGDGG